MVVLYAKHRRPMQLQSILRRAHPIPGFVYGSVELCKRRGGATFFVQVRPRRKSHPICSGCDRKGRGYDTLKERQFDFVPLWAMPVVFLYAMRRVDCPRCGVTVEMVPWATGKSPLVLPRSERDSINLLYRESKESQCPSKPVVDSVPSRRR